MSHHARELDPADKQALGAKAWPAYNTAFIIGGVAILLAAVLAVIDGGEIALRRFAYSYLTGLSLILGIALGCLFFVIITHLFRAGWCAAIRRIPEAYAAAMPTLLVMALPLLLLVAVDGISKSENPNLYAWTAPYDVKHGHGGDHHDAKPRHDEAAPHDDHGDHAAAVTDERAVSTALIPSVLGGADSTSPVLAQTPGQARMANEVLLANRAPGTPRDPDSDQPAYTPGKTLKDQQAYYAEMVPYFTKKKQPYLSWWFYCLRIVFYFAVWIAIARYYFAHSKRQDEVGRDDIEPTKARERRAPLVVILYAMTVTFASFDLIMSLDPAWYSTIFGVYYFAGCFLTANCVIVITLRIFQKLGYLKTVGVDHYHDLGKLMFAFTFFWAYIAFSQYMLIWYASFPETTYWFELRGFSTVVSQGALDESITAPQTGSGWSWLGISLLFLKFVFPFLFLLSAHVKRNLRALTFIAVWIIVMQYVDLYWLIMPMLDRTAELRLPFVDLLLVVGFGGVLVGAMLKKLKDAPLIAHGDPRMHESLALDTTAWAPMHDPNGHH
ncbi:MAG: hypothetical protein AAGI68_10975 [Planctomycetota bacterium]